MADDTLDASTLPVDIILDIAEYLAKNYIVEDDSTEGSVASESFENRDSPLLVSQTLSLVNRHWAKAMTHSKVYLSADFTIRADRDAERIRNWISARKNKRIVYLYLAINNMRQYKSLRDDLSGITYDFLDLDFRVGMNKLALPQHIEVRRLALMSMRPFTLKPSQLRKSLIDSLEELEMMNVSFKKFESVNKSQYSFSKLKSFDLDCDGSSQQGLHTMKNFVTLMPVLKKLSISCDYLYEDDEKCIAPLVSFPTSLNTVTSFTCDNVRADLNRCKWPNLEELYLYKGFRLGRWRGLTDKLRVVELHDAYIGKEHDICKPGPRQKLKNLTSFALVNIRLPEVYMLLNDGSFDDDMPNLEKLNVVSVKTGVKADAIMRFVERHPSLRSVTVEDSEEFSNMALPSGVKLFKKQTPRERYLADDFDFLGIYDVFADASDSGDFDHGGIEDEYNEVDGGTDYDGYGDYDYM